MYALARTLEKASMFLHTAALHFYPEPEIVTTSDYREIYRLLRDIPWIKHPIVLDRPHHILSKESMEQFLKLNPVSERVYIAEEFDCDNFAFRTFTDFKDWCPLGSYGIVIGPTHAWNMFLMSEDDVLKVVFVEPQNNNMFSRTDEVVRYAII